MMTLKKLWKKNLKNTKLTEYEATVIEASLNRIQGLSADRINKLRSDSEQYLEAQKLVAQIETIKDKLSELTEIV